MPGMYERAPPVLYTRGGYIYIYTCTSERCCFTRVRADAALCEGRLHVYARASAAASNERAPAAINQPFLDCQQKKSHTNSKCFVSTKQKWVQFSRGLFTGGRSRANAKKKDTTSTVRSTSTVPKIAPSIPPSIRRVVYICPEKYPTVITSITGQHSNENQKWRVNIRGYLIFGFIVGTEFTLEAPRNISSPKTSGFSSEAVAAKKLNASEFQAREQAKK